MDYKALAQILLDVQEGSTGSLTAFEKIDNLIIDHNKTLQQWQPIETAPKDGQSILVYFKPHGPVMVSWSDTDGNTDTECSMWCVDDYKHGPYRLRGYMSGDDTHWMFLPPKPEE